MERCETCWEREKEDGRSMVQESRMTRAEAARKGGRAVSANREHMAQIGRKGGQTVSQNREHMARIGEKGGTARRGRGA